MHFVHAGMYYMMMQVIGVCDILALSFRQSLFLRADWFATGQLVVGVSALHDTIKLRQMQSFTIRLYCSIPVLVACHQMVRTDDGIMYHTYDPFRSDKWLFIGHACVKKVT